jgi:AraC family transcriptional regulator, exoenzyme S synthesis regulatory protein ExsA
VYYKFPPQPLPVSDNTFITGRTDTFAKLKIVTQAEKRTVHLTEHTMLFVISGVKLLHFPEETIQVGPGNIVLLKKGIYVMAEYIEEGLQFEALLLFLPLKLLRTFDFKKSATRSDKPFVIFPADILIHAFRDQLRQYFEKRLEQPDELLAHKQKEILLLLMASGHQTALLNFLSDATSTRPDDLEYTVKSYVLHPITIAELANLTNRSLATFKRDFKKQFNCSPRVWINQQRLAHARLLLQNTPKSISEIADDCGFESTSYFIRLFKSEYGDTPGAIRAETAII